MYKRKKDGKETREEYAKAAQEIAAEAIAAEEVAKAAEEFAKAAEEIAYVSASGVTNGRGVGTSC